MLESSTFIQNDTQSSTHYEGVFQLNCIRICIYMFKKLSEKLLRQKIHTMHKPANQFSMQFNVATQREPKTKRNFRTSIIFAIT